MNYKSQFSKYCGYTINVLDSILSQGFLTINLIYDNIFLDLCNNCLKIQLSKTTKTYNK